MNPAATPGQVWKHPAEWYPASVQRWFEALPPALRYSEPRFRKGDDPAWSAPNLDDSAWERRGLLQIPSRTGIHWIRFRVRMGNEGLEPPPSGIMVTSLQAYDLYWDGVLLGSSGVPGATREAEQVGRVDQWFSIPTPLCGAGEHVVALRASSYRVGFPNTTSGLRLMMDSPSVLQGIALREAFVPTLAAGALFMIGLTSLILWALAAHRTPLILLGGLCFADSLMQGIQAVRWFFHYPADWHYPAYFVMTTFVAVQGLLTLAFAIAHFRVPRGGWLMLALGLLLAAVAAFNPDRLIGVRLLAAGIVANLITAMWAVGYQRRGAWPAVLGILTSAVLLAMSPEDFRANFFVTYFPTLCGLICSLAITLRDERRDARAVELAAARLELELLKKNIQPHFLLNTLATIIETIEQEPKTAVAMVESLAGEFRILSRIAGEKLIPLSQELELCRAHLRVMSRRRGVHCALTTTGVDEQAPVPPALFHTLVENGLTHLLPRDGHIDFELLATQVPGATRYRLIARGERQPDDPARAHAPRVGTGLRYIEARLEESFPQRWSLRSEPTPEGWQTTLELSSPFALKGAGA
ncbi:MAG: histidine kinase [Opitutaceae bacterium]